MAVTKAAARGSTGAPGILVARPARCLTLRRPVLVVEDEETICEIVARFLEDDGLVRVTAHSGEAALEWLHSNKPWADLFIVDVRLPGMRGPEFALEALRIRQGTSILYISGYPQALLEDHPLSDTMAFLAKPFSYEQLLGEVRRLSIGSPAQGS